MDIKEALETLDDESRLMLSMSVLGGYTSDEIAKFCNSKPSTIRSKMSRIKSKLRLHLSDVYTERSNDL